MHGLEFQSTAEMMQAASGVVRIEQDGVEILDASALRGHLIDRIVWSAVFGEGDLQVQSRWLIRHLAEASGAWTASIHDLYMAAGRDAYSNITTPAINLRAMAYDLARTVFQAAHETGTRQVIFELARSEMGYTQQRPSEYASVVLGAAIREGWKGPVFIQGDHFQTSLKAWGQDPDAEIEAVRNLAIEAIQAGYGNIDIDTSTLVDLSQSTLAEQQRTNYTYTAALTAAIREVEPPGVTISIGGEIGEVGTTNSTVEDLEAFMAGYTAELTRLEAEMGRELKGISKISVQTGTSHGGIVLPDGSIKEVSVDFDTLARLSEISRTRYGLGGAVQHGASTLPETAFDRFASSNAVEVHLATAFQNAIFDSPYFPAELLQRVHAYLDENHSDERKDGQTDTQFYYNARKRAIGPFKRELWTLSDEIKEGILAHLRGRFGLIMRELGVAGKGDIVTQHVKHIPFPVHLPDGSQPLTNVDLGDEGE
jgi:fructose/tagatose bisphosphate aldolase